jgi:hypothetical protein
VKGRYVIHTYFTRFQPTSIVHDFTAEQFKDMSLQLYPFLKIKTAFQEMEGILDSGIIFVVAENIAIIKTCPISVQ